MAKAPMNPLAGVPGPGPFSVRNDNLNLGSTAYGEGQETAMLNTAAPKSKTRGIADNVGGRPANPLQTVTPIFADSQNKAQDIMTGAPMGPGAGPEALVMQSKFAGRKTSDILVDLIPYDETGEITILYQQALSRGQ
jgi:hypothetical protein